MDDLETLLSALLQKYPNLERLPDDRLRNALADIFETNKEAQKMAFNLIRKGKLEEPPAPQVSSVKIQSVQIPSIKRSSVEIESAPSSPTRAAKKKLLDAHPALPYPPYTTWENIRDYCPSILSRIIWPMIWAGGIVLGVPSYLLTLLFSHFDKSSWNIYVWCVYGLVIIILLYGYIKDFKNLEINSLLNPRKCDVAKRERLQKIIAEKGYKDKAEQTMRTIYKDIRLNKDKYSYNQKVKMLETAYVQALEDVLCHFEEDDRWAFLETNDDSSLRQYAHLYEKYYGDKSFNPYKNKEAYI